MCFCESSIEFRRKKTFLQVFGEIERQLLDRPDQWSPLAATAVNRNKFHLLIADRGRIDYAQLLDASASNRIVCADTDTSSSAVISKQVNYLRGFTELTMKSRMAKYDLQCI
jgi:hypothetical protein